METSEPYSFAKQAAVGRRGEEVVIAWLRERGYEVEDVSASPLWRQRDVDVIVGARMAEIKTDTHSPDNLFVELTDDDKPGYLYKSRADDLLYYFPHAGKLFWLPVASLAWWVHEHANDLRRIEVRSRRHRGGSPWVSVGIAVPVQSLREAGLILEYDL